MPSVRSRQVRPFAREFRPWLTILPLIAGVIGALAPPAPGAPATVLAVRSSRAELAYRLTDASPAAVVELWYTRDRAATWQRWGSHTDHDRPLIFDAPAEGLYGFILIVCDGEQRSAPPPEAHVQPQRWVFIDYTPPLVQWDRVEPADAFASRRIVRMSWTAHDDNLPSRPVAISYQSSIDQTWRLIDPALPNTGRYDWKVPADVAGQLTLKLAVRDLGGHVVERSYGPVPLDHWLTAPVTVASSTSQPASNDPASRVSSTRPAAADRPSLAQRRKAEELYQQGSWHLVRGQYAVAAERFREALEIDPDMISAVNDLAGVYYLQKDYAKALEHYNQVLERDKNHHDALRGAALAYVAQRQYAQSRDMLEQLVAANENDVEAWLDLGDVLFMMGDHDDALSRWSRVAKAGRAADTDASMRDVIRKARRRLDLYGSAKTNRVAGMSRK